MPTRHLIDPYNHTGYAQVLIEDNGTNETHYVIGSDVLSQADDYSSAKTELQSLLYDGLGSTRQLIADDGTTVTASYSYDAYGMMLGGNPSSAPDTNLLYAGEYFDTALQHYYNRARWYDPSNGTFNRTDPFAGNNLDPQSLHKYTYAHNNPINGIDPSGQSLLISTIIVATVLAVLIGTYYYYARMISDKKCGADICGPDVTVALMEFKDNLIEKFDNYEKWKQDGLCEGMWGLNGWDIKELVNPGNYPDCATGNCFHSVEVHGKCYDTFHVNYFMWGLINSLCGNWKSTMLTGLQWTRVSGGHKCKRAWALAGYERTTWNVHCSGDDKCDTKKCNRVVTELHERWKWVPSANYWN